jgi:endonuclease YncB( thermonuclease family)
MQALIVWWNKRLDSLKVNDVGNFSFNGIKKIAKVVDVYDGDSITVIFKFNGKYQKFKIRMDGYDTPELRSHNVLEKEYAVRAREALQKMVLDKLIKLECGKNDKYGRILGKVCTLDGICVNDYMVQNKFGYSYTGGTKVKFEDYMVLKEK